jgi:hypothetical protein
MAVASRFLPALVAAALLLTSSSVGAGPKALFDNSHAETAGNADWQIDTDQPLPVPDQSTVTPATLRTYWLGAISSWGIDLVKRGYSVATLTSAYGISYGNAGNPYDLSNYDVFIVPEPNTKFTTAESTAIFNFVRDGGGLMAVSDHAGSDRNNDGFDSPQIWNLLDSQHLFGVHFGSTGDVNNNIVQDTGNFETALSDSIIHGPNGTADSLSFHNGTTMTLYPGVNASVRGDFWMAGLAHGTTGLMAAHSVYGNGRIFFAGDSSPIDDGSAAPGNSSIFDGWGEAAGRDSLLFQNATAWVTRRPPDVTATPRADAGIFRLRAAVPNPSRGTVALSFSLGIAADVRLEILDLAGRRVRTLVRGSQFAGEHSTLWDGRDAAGRRVRSGTYIARLASGSAQLVTRIIRL